MKNTELAQKIKQLRNRKGYSQEELAERSGLSLRTIQRIEKGETEPRGDSLKRLAEVFEVNADELSDWTVREDKGYLAGMNFSALLFLFFPLLGILMPLILWVAKKDRIRSADETGREILNFQLGWLILLIMGNVIIFILSIHNMKTTQHISADIAQPYIRAIYLFNALMYLYNITLIIINAIKINREQKTAYYPPIRFLRK